MVATFIAILFALFQYYHPISIETSPNVRLLAEAIILIAALFLIVLIAGQLFLSFPLQRAEEAITPRVVSLYLGDLRLRSINIWLIIFILFSFILAIDFVYFENFNKNHLLAFWMILLGISIDAWQLYIKRVLSYLNPYSIIEIFTTKGKQAILSDNEPEFYRCFNGLVEIALKGGISLNISVLNKLQLLIQLLLDSQKSLSIKGGMKNKINDLLIYFYQRFEVINEKATANGFEPTNTHLLFVLGNVITALARYDISFAPHALRVFGKLAKTSLTKNLPDSAIKNSCILLDVAARVSKEPDLKSLSIRDLYICLANQIDEIIKEAFKLDKSLNLKVLTQPLYELRKLFQDKLLISHPDTAAVVQHIDDILEGYTALEAMLHALPPIPEDLRKQGGTGASKTIS